VVIPTHNRATFISAAIESILAQRNSECSYEIIVVDDGSTDDTEEVLRPYANSIRYCKIDHSGLPAKARNVGISEARGELIAFLDSDDLWVEEKFALQVPVFDDPAVMMSYGQARKIHGNDRTPREHVVDPVKLPQGKSFLLLLEQNVISTLTVVARRSALLQVGGFDESPELRGVEDYELWLRLIAAFPNGIASVPSVIALYRVHGDGIGAGDSLGAISRLIAVYDTVWRCDALTTEHRSALEAQLIRMHENWSRQQVLDGNVPAISVVMSVYRDRPFVAQAIRSILDQTFEDFELIVVDDGSDDGSYDVVAQFADERIRIVRQTNHGLVSALNKGIRLARGALIARQDADDISLPQRLDRQFGWMSANPWCDVVGTFFRYVDEKTLEPTGVTITAPTKHLDIVRHMYFDNPIGHGTVVIRREAIVAVGGYSALYGPNEDFDLWRRIVAAGGRIALLPDVHYLYRVNSSGISKTTPDLQHRLFAELLSEVWRGPIRSKSFWNIAADNRYYARLPSPFQKTVHQQYKSDQISLAVEFVRRRHLRSGANTCLGILLIDPMSALRLGKSLIRKSIRRVTRLARSR
jgi:glycosyltransferase involved in cell wall biosynthesis